MELVNEKRGSKRRGSKKDEEEARRGRMESFLYLEMLWVLWDGIKM